MKFLGFGKQNTAQAPVTMPAPLDASGQINWDAVPAGAALELAVNHQGHNLHGQKFLVTRKQNGVLAIVSRDGTRERPFPQPAPQPPDPARGVSSLEADARATDIATALGALYGSDAPPTDYLAETQTFALACGVDPERASFIARTVQDRIDHVLRARSTELRYLGRERAAYQAARAFNGKRESAATPDIATIWYGHGTGIQLSDSPITETVMARAAQAADTPDAVTLLARPLTFTIARAEMKSFRNAPPLAIAHELGVILSQQTATLDALHQLPLVEPWDAAAPYAEPATTRMLTLTTPALSPADLTGGAAQTALTLHATHDSLRLHALADTTVLRLPLPPLPPETGGKDKHTTRLLAHRLADAAHTWTLQADAAVAAAPFWTDPDQVEAHIPLLGGFLGAAVSEGAASASGLPLLAHVLPPEGVGVGLALSGTTSPLALFADDILTIATDQAREALAKANDSDPLVAARALVQAGRAVGEALGVTQTIAAALWATETVVPALAAATPETVFLEARCGDDSGAALALVRTLNGTDSDSHAELLHDGTGFVVRYSCAQLLALMRGQEQLTRHAPGDEPAADWLLRAGGGIVPYTDFLPVLCRVVQARLGPGTRRLCIAVPERDLERVIAALTTTACFPAPAVLSLDHSQLTAAGLHAARIVIGSYRALYENLDIAQAVRPQALLLVEPPLLSWERGGGIAAPLTALMALATGFRAVFTDHTVLDSPLRMYDLANWSQRVRRSSRGGSFGSVTLASPLPTRHDAWGLERGVGSGTAAERLLTHAAFLPFVAPNLWAANGRSISYHEQTVSLDSGALRGIDDALTRAAASLPRERLRGDDTKEGHGQRQATRLRPALERVFWTWTETGDNPKLALLRRVATALPQSAVFVSEADGGLQREAVTQALPGIPILSRAERGAGLAAINHLHVLGDPQGAISLLGADAGSEFLVVYGYRYANAPWDNGGWRALRAVIAAL